jgi:hypothetical protein
MNNVITDYKQQPEYKVVSDFIKELVNDGTLLRFQGACLPASEITQAILHSRGLKVRMVECNAMVINSPSNGGTIEIVGFNSLVPLGPNETDTHFIVLVEAEIPFVIDLSIGHKMGNPKYSVIAPLDATDPDIIAQASFKGASVTYRVKKNPRYLTLHQKTMLEKLQEENNLRGKLSLIEKLVMGAIGLAVFNAVANIAVVWLKTMT